MRRRLDLAGALVADPQVLFLDEPTTGLDPRSRTDMWEVIEDLVAGGTTPAADHAVPRGGRPARRPDRRRSTTAGSSPRAPPTSSRPRSAASGSRSSSPTPARLRRRARELLGRLGRRRAVDGRRAHAGRCSVPVSGGAAVPRRGAAPARRRGQSPSTTSACAGPTLDDVFLTLTGHAAEPTRARRSTGSGHDGRPADRAMPMSRPRRDRRLVVAKRNLIKIKRVPDLLVFTTLSPIMFVLLFAYVFGGAIDVPGRSSYREFLMAGIFAQTVVFGATITGAGLAEDMQKGIIDRFRSLPMSPVGGPDRAARSPTSLNNVLVLVVMSLTGLVVGWRIHTVVWRGAAPASCCCWSSPTRSRGSWPASGCWCRARGGQQRRVHRALPADLHRQHLRAARAPCPACCRRSPTWNPVSAVTQAARELFGNPNPNPRPRRRRAGRSSTRWPTR